MQDHRILQDFLRYQLLFNDDHRNFHRGLQRPPPLRRFHVASRLFPDGDDHHDLISSRRKSQELREPASVKPFHGARVQSQRFRRDHQVFASQRCALRRPFEKPLPRHRRHPNRLPKMNQPENRPFQRPKHPEPPLYEKPFRQVRFPRGLGNLGFAESFFAHPFQLALHGHSPRPDVRHRDDQRRRRFRWRLPHAKPRRALLYRRRFHPVETVWLHVKARRSHARRVQNPLAHRLRDFYGLELPDRPSSENRREKI